MTPQVTIVIVNWNGGQLLMQCLESIRAHTCAGRISVIVVDNNSTDGSREAATERFPEFQTFNSGANLGFGRANNLARHLVDAPHVLFLNPDAELTSGALDRALECLTAHPDVGALGCRMIAPDGSVHDLGLQWTMSPWTALVELLFVNEHSRRQLGRWLPTIDPHHSAYVKKLYGGCLLVRRDVLDAAGWFDERYFMYGEDADLSRTIRELGWKLFYCADATVLHVGGGVTIAAPSTFSYLMKQESINKLIAKYGGWSSAVMHRAAVLLGGLVRLGVVFASESAAALLHKDEASRAYWRISKLKQQQLVLWSLGLRKATVPGSRTC